MFYKKRSAPAQGRSGRLAGMRMAGVGNPQVGDSWMARVRYPGDGAVGSMGERELCEFHGRGRGRGTRAWVLPD